MGLMKFLAAGHSLGRIADEPSRYRMDQRGLLPKFGSPKNGRGVPLRLAPGANDWNIMKATETQSAVGPAPTAPAKDPKPWLSIGRWSLFKNPFAGRGQARAVKPPVQCELSLDAVKPVRNDLSDSDVEVVAAPVPAGVVIPPPAQVPTAPVVIAAPPIWGRIKTQYFGAGKT